MTALKTIIQHIRRQKLADSVSDYKLTMIVPRYKKHVQDFLRLQKDCLATANKD